jgi:hypothetical protein
MTQGNGSPAALTRQLARDEDRDEDRWYIVVIRELDGQLNALSRRSPGPDGEPFTGPWAALTSAESRRALFRYDRDPRWSE